MTSASQKSVTGSNPVVKVLNFFRFIISNHLNWESTATAFLLLSNHWYVLSKEQPFLPVGKSTFLRQNALIAILAQAGSFVPAQNATLGK